MRESCARFRGSNLLSDVSFLLADIQDASIVQIYHLFEASMVESLTLSNQDTAVAEAGQLIFKELKSYFDTMFTRIPMHSLQYRLVTPEVLKQEMIIYLRLSYIELLVKYFPSEATVSLGQDFEPQTLARWLRDSEPAKSLWTV